MAKKNLISVDDLDKFKKELSPAEKAEINKQAKAAKAAQAEERKLKKSRRGCGCSRAKRRREQKG